MSKENPFEDISPVPNIEVGYFEKEEYLEIINNQARQIDNFAYQIMALQSKIETLEKTQRLHGEWIKGPEISRTMIGDRVKCIEYKDYTCSNCGLVLDYLLYHWDGSPFYKFCPECGAEMREEAKND